MNTEELKALALSSPSVGLNAGIKTGLYACLPSLHIPAASIDRKIYPLTQEQYDEIACQFSENRR